MQNGFNIVLGRPTKSVHAAGQRSRWDFGNAKSFRRTGTGATHEMSCTHSKALEKIGCKMDIQPTTLTGT